MTALLVTGGAGYIGSQTAHACVDAGFEVVIVDDLRSGLAECAPRDAAFIQGDVGDAALVRRVVRERRIAAVIHFAGSIVVPESIARPGEYYENNTAKSLALARAVLAEGASAFLFSSTAAVYAPTSAGRLSEDAPKAPMSPYGRSKLMTEQILADLSAAHGLKVGVLRYFNVAGADPQGRTGQCAPNATHLIKGAVQAALGVRPSLPVYGRDYPTPDGTCIRDYVHVADLADAHVLAVERLLQGGEAFALNCGYGRGASVLEVIRAVEAAHGARLRLEDQPRRPGDPPRVVSDPSRLKAALPWRPRFESLQAIVASALAWEKALLANGGRPPLRAA